MFGFIYFVVWSQILVTHTFEENVPSAYQSNLYGFWPLGVKKMLIVHVDLVFLMVM